MGCRLIDSDSAPSSQLGGADQSDRGLEMCRAVSHLFVIDFRQELSITWPTTVGTLERVLVRVETQEKFVTKPVAILQRGGVRRELVKRFPYIVMFVETEDMRRVIVIRRGNVDARRWQSRI